MFVDVEVAALGVNDALAVDEQQPLAARAQRQQQACGGDAGGAGADDDDLDVLEALALDLQRVQEPGAGDDRRAVLVVVKDRNLEPLAQRLLDGEAARRGDVLEVDAAEGGRDVGDRLDEGLRARRLHLDVEDVDVGEALEQDRLALHHRLAGERADVAEAEHRRAVGNDGDEVALVGVAVGVGRVAVDLPHRFGHAGGVSQREIVGARKGLRRPDRDLTRAGLLVIIQCVLSLDQVDASSNPVCVAMGLPARGAGRGPKGADSSAGARVGDRFSCECGGRNYSPTATGRLRSATHSLQEPG